MTRKNAIALEVFVITVLAGVVLGMIAPKDQYMGITQKIMFVHVPMALGLGVMLVWLSIGSWLFLALKVPILDSMNRATTLIGVIVGCLALVTGAFWGRITWGVFWTWDPRLVSTALMTIYVLALHLLRESLEDSPRGPMLTAGLGSLAILGYAVIHLSVQWWDSLHQQATILRPDGARIQGMMAAALYVSIIGWIGVLFSLVALRTRTNELENQVREKESALELGEAG